MTDHEQIYPYVVDELTPAEAAEVERHLATCPACAAEVEDLRTALAELTSTIAVAPPATLRDTVLAAIEVIPQVSSMPAQTSPAGHGVPAQAATSTDLPPVRHLKVPPTAPTAPQRRTQSRWPALLAAAAVVAALALGGWAWHERESAQSSAQQAAAQTARLTKLLSAGDVKLIKGRTVRPGTTGTVVLSRSRREVIMVASNLPDLPHGKVYETWTTIGKPSPAGTFSPTDARTIVQLPAKALRASSLSVTVEPAGGSPAPTSRAIFVAHLPESA